jgi:hypothetical protein
MEVIVQQGRALKERGKDTSYAHAPAPMQGATLTRTAFFIETQDWRPGLNPADRWPACDGINVHAFDYLPA